MLEDGIGVILLRNCYNHFYNPLFPLRDRQRERERASFTPSSFPASLVTVILRRIGGVTRLLRRKKNG